MRYIYFILIIGFVVTTGCENSKKRKSTKYNSNLYAKGFEIEKLQNGTKLSVFNPWEKAQNVKVEYVLLEKNKKIDEEKYNARVIKVPVNRVICLSTTHLAFMDVLNENDAVVGISGSRYVSNKNIRKRMQKGLVPDVGYGQNLDYETILSQKPELVMIYGVGSEVTNQAQKLEELGIPTVIVAEYLEGDPLGKVEWVKVVGELMGKQKLANDYFLSVEKKYNKLKEVVKNVNKKPKVLVGAPFKETWWVPGGKSYLANLINDAGGDYLGKQNPSHESYVVSFENAWIWGNMADVWINVGNFLEKKELINTESRFEKFNVFNKGNIYNNVKRLSKHGGNDFWESGTVNPHLILQDLISVFHPEIVKENLIYYKKIE